MGGWVIEPFVTEVFKSDAQWFYYFNCIGTAEADLIQGASIGMLFGFLKLLSCKNITTQIIEPPAKVNKKQLKNGRKPQIVSYRVLGVQMPHKPGSGKKAGTIQRLHMCRGHFKTFTADKPLFGKLTGTFWIQPHVRGKNNKEEN